MDKREKRVRECIATLKNLKLMYEREATPRMPLRSLRSDLTLTIALLEKQIPKKPDNEKNGRGKCPSCSRYISELNSPLYCPCGQAVKWSETNKESEV